MADIRGVGKKITYSEDNPISAEVDALRKSRDNIKRPPADDEERERLARWLAHRGRDEGDEGAFPTRRRGGGGRSRWARSPRRGDAPDLLRRTGRRRGHLIHR